LCEELWRINYFNNRRSALDCLVRDFSPYGARLIFSNAVTTPDVLELYIPQKERTLRVHVIWRHGEEVGVAFAQIAELENPADIAELAERVARLDAEVAALRRAEEAEVRRRARVRGGLNRRSGRIPGAARPPTLLANCIQ
jgi:hypothetical protein